MGLKLDRSAFEVLTMSKISLSLDYLDGFYLQREERQSQLQETYNFTCDCLHCNRPDVTRAFKCQACVGGRVCPLNAEWKCLACNTTVEDPSTFLNVESEFVSSPPKIDTLEDLGNLMQSSPLHESHNLLFFTLLEAGEMLASDPMLCKNGQAETIWTRVIINAELVLPKFHPEKVKLYDSLGQIFVSAGKIQQAKLAFTKAHEVSCITSGQNSPATLDVLKLVANTPSDIKTLMQHYQNRKIQEEEEELIEFMAEG